MLRHEYGDFNVEINHVNLVPTRISTIFGGPLWIEQCEHCLEALLS